jgi:acyl phosphate:glycerol-3-phosphate acyltransferase
MPLQLMIIAILVAYLLGSIPTSVWVGRFFYGIDIRQHGSGNAGATNTFRVLGAKAGIPVFIFDVLKAFVAVNLVTFIDYFTPETSAFINMQLGLGCAAVLGHIFPIYVGFKGGKGVASLFGVVLAIHPEAAMISSGIFFGMLVVSKYVSLSSMIAGISFPIIIIGFYHTTIVSLVVFSLTISILLLFTHQKNIERLLKNQESKANLFKKRK